MSRQIITNHNSRPASTYQSVNQQSRTSYSRASNEESVTGTSDLYRSPTDYGRVRESRNIFGKYLSFRGRQERRENKEFANYLKENDRVFAANRRKDLEDRHRDEEARRRERLERISREEEDKVQEEMRALAIERNGGWYQQDLEREEERRHQGEISRTIAASPPRQRVRGERRMGSRSEEERIQRDKSREEKRARQLNRLKRKDRIQEGEILRKNYRYRGERQEEESQALRLFSAWERGFDVQGEEDLRWVLGLAYQPNYYPVVPLCDRVGSRPSIPLPRQRPSRRQLHRPAPPPPPPPSQSSQPPRPPRLPQPHQTPQTPQTPQSLPPPPLRRRPVPYPPYNTNSPPRIKIEHIASPPSSPPPRRSRHNHNPDPREPRSSSRGRSHPQTSKHALAKSNIAQHNEKRHSSINNNPAATKDSRSKHNENRHSSINNTPTAKEHSKPNSKDNKFISRTSRIKTSGRARVKDCVQVGGVVGRVGADVGRLLWGAVTIAALAIPD
ncbi:hypothetical protein BTUL_0142g00310 [Botrytis tulipae]|uniref:Uncharacterized protein n=1 Tax=Botrytis tulipae TaxID=87230 RepID=A0A4Z1EHC9_9HELO|nr:hypothetical protein BTUL_0142g00310 [Botrytis tulipae]